jgi:hypothetical protein
MLLRKKAGLLRKKAGGAWILAPLSAPVLREARNGAGRFGAVPHRSSIACGQTHAGAIVSRYL